MLIDYPLRILLLVAPANSVVEGLTEPGTMILVFTDVVFLASTYQSQNPLCPQ